MMASPFFTSGRSAILPSIATPEELHTANSLTQTTGWITLAVGAFFGGTTCGKVRLRSSVPLQLAFVLFLRLLHLAAALAEGHFRAKRTRRQA